MSLEQLVRTDTTVRKKFREYFWPTVFTSVGVSVASILDQIIVGNMLGSNALAALNLFSPVMQIYFVLSCLIGIGAVNLISVAKGKGDDKEANSANSMGLVAVLLVSAVLMILQFLCLNIIVDFLSAEPKLKQMVREYYIPFIIGTPFYFLMSYYSYIIRIDGRPNFSFGTVLISNVVDAAFSAGLIAIFPEFGIRGAAVGTVVGRTAGFLILMTHYFKRKNEIKLSFSGNSFSTSVSKLWQIGRNGLSGTLGDLLIVFRLAFQNAYLQTLGIEPGIALVALSVSTSCQILISAFIAGASDTVVPLVGVLVGQKDNKGIRMTMKYAWKCLFISSVIITVLLEAFPWLLAGLFGIQSTAELLEVIPAIRICALGFIGFSGTELLIYYYTSVGKISLSLVSCVVKSIGLIIPFTLLLCNFMGLHGAWWAFVISCYGSPLLIWLFALITKKCSKGKYADNFLLEAAEPSEIAFFSINSEPVAMANELENLHRFMEGCKVPASVAYKVTMMVEETSNIAKAIKGRVDMDVRICIIAELGEVEVTIRDNGGDRAPLIVNKTENMEEKLSETAILLALAKRVEHSTVLGFHQTTLTIDIGAANIVK